MIKLAVWHDGSCPLCKREISLMRRLDKAGSIDFIDIATVEQASCPIDRSRMLERFHVQEDGVLLSGAEAFAAMWRAIPLLRPLGTAARIPTVLPVLKYLYRSFLFVRPSLQRLAVSAGLS